MMAIADKLGVKLGQTVVTVNAPNDGTWDIPAQDEADLATSDVVVGFIQYRRDVHLLSSVFTAVSNGRRAWVCYPKPGQLDSDVDRVWLFPELHRHCAGPVDSISINDTWAAVLLRPGLYSDTDITEILAWPEECLRYHRHSNATSNSLSPLVSQPLLTVQPRPH